MTNHNDSKQCTKCQTEKPLSDYYSQKNKRDGKASWCKSCVQDYQRKRYQDPDVREHIRQYHADYYANPEIKDKRKRYLREYNQRDYAIENRRQRIKTDEVRARRNEQSRIRYATDNQYRIGVIRRNKKWRAAEYSKPVQRAALHRRLSRLRNASGTHTASDIAAIRAAQTDRKGRLRCWWCSEVITDYHVDHKIPLSRGGSNSADNLCLACPTCNLRKNAQTPAEFAGRLI